jgi:ribosomal protein S27E
VSSTTLSIKGKTEPGAMVTVNGEGVKVDADGGFEKSVDLDIGTNLITVTARDEAGNEVKVTRAINREAFYVPSQYLLLLIIVMLVMTVAAMVYAHKAHRRLKDVTSTKEAPKRGKAEQSRPRGKRPRPVTREAPSERKGREREEDVDSITFEDEGGMSRPDIISKIRSTENEETVQLMAASSPDADEVTLETEDPAIGAAGTDDVELEEGVEEEELEEEIEEELEMEETSRRPLAQVKCNGCSHVIPIFSNERPLKVQCPSCGKLGMIR